MFCSGIMCLAYGEAQTRYLRSRVKHSTTTALLEKAPELRAAQFPLDHSVLEIVSRSSQ